MSWPYHVFSISGLASCGICAFYLTLIRREVFRFRCFCPLLMCHTHRRLFCPSTVRLSYRDDSMCSRTSSLSGLKLMGSSQQKRLPRSQPWQQGSRLEYSQTVLQAVNTSAALSIVEVRYSLHGRCENIPLPPSVLSLNSTTSLT